MLDSPHNARLIDLERYAANIKPTQNHLNGR